MHPKEYCILYLQWIINELQLLFTEQLQMLKHKFQKEEFLCQDQKCWFRTKNNGMCVYILNSSVSSSVVNGIECFYH